MTLPKRAIPRRRARRWALMLALPAALVVVLLALTGSAFDGRPVAADAASLREVLQLRAGMTVAEIGAGDGRLAVEVARIVGPRGAMFATELDPSLLERIGQRARGAGLANMTAVRAAEHATNLPANCCDAIFMRRVYHDLSDPAAILRDLRRALKPGARLAIIDFEPTALGNLVMPRRPNRNGHGIAKADLVREVSAELFALEGPVRPWPDDRFFVAVFRTHQLAESPRHLHLVKARLRAAVFGREEGELDRRPLVG